MKTVKVLDKSFKLYIPHDKIQEHIARVANQINTDLKGKDIIFMGILNGSFMFASDLMKLIDLPSQITFLKLASYQGTNSTGSVKRLIGLNEDISGKTVVVIEDIVDTGITLEQIQKQLIGYEPAAIKYATLLFKPNAYKGKIDIDYVGIEIPNDFILGYGLDYNGYGRNLADLYVINE
ncbi:MAG: hypoxanthine phosphoribosyltransferase [Salinivirgaceae bacterium]|jgi:hypoxanthine phosphoribosyltransferase|nr:hypoxanthine phosphoribosyltransferase [Salinivirgaceae bacterium]MDD4747455.1 hypoxanthine phosphoribosyltransferase [Salinivirgaceae bacterium]MDY0281817.1 hypoxanthine phosphoribosyltransferase [Salinivirgaceae bacterium]